jgi:hypothetical protein
LFKVYRESVVQPGFLDGIDLSVPAAPCSPSSARTAPRFSPRTRGVRRAGDPRFVWEMIRGLLAGGIAIFLTTQYLEEADQLADRITALADGTAAELKARVPATATGLTVTLDDVFLVRSCHSTHRWVTLLRPAPLAGDVLVARAVAQRRLGLGEPSNKDATRPGAVAN